MSISWGYSPKIEKYIPLGDFPIDKYLVIAKQAIENLGWELSHISERGLIAYTPISFQSYSEEVSIEIVSNFAIVKSECIGIQMLFTDYGKNDQNLEKFFHEFEYVEFHLKDFWEESLAKFHAFAATQDVDYFEKAPLTVKNKIKNVLYLFIPRKGYIVTPILVYLNILYYLSYFLIAGLAQNQAAADSNADFFIVLRNFYGHIFANNRAFVLSGQLWRLVTYSFIHVNFLHLFFNMYVLVYFGLMAENKLGVLKFITIYLLGGICGGLASVMMHDVGFGIGASGSIMALSGAFFALLLCNTFEKSAAKALLISTSISVAITLINGLQSGIDNAAHIGGIISGFTIALVLISNSFGSFSINAGWKYIISSLSVALLAIGVFVFTPNYNSGQFDKLQEFFEENTADYHKVSEITNDQSTLQKIKTVRKYGIDLWERNARIVYDMHLIKLDDEHIIVRDYYEKITNATIQLEKLRHAYYKNHDPIDQQKMDQLQRKITALKKEAKEKVELDFP